MMKLCVVTTVFPEPLDEGDPLRIRAIINGVRADPVDQVTVIAVMRPSTEDAHVRALAADLAEVSLIVLPSPLKTGAKSVRSRLARTVRAIATCTPPAMYSQAGSRLNSSLSKVVDSDTGVILIGEPAGLALDSAVTSRARFVVWDKANVLTASSSLLSSEVEGIHRLWTLLLVRLSRSFERRTAALVSDVWVTSSIEASRLQDYVGVTASAVLPSCVQGESVRPVQSAVASREVLWMSSFGYYPNRAGLLRLLQEGHSELRRMQARIRIVGSGLDDKFRDELDAFRDVIDVWGFVPDLSSAVRGVRAAVVPIWLGGGVKLKTLTLMSYGLPVVGTKQAMEGIDDSAALAVSDDPLVLIEAVFASSPAELKEAGVRARAEVLTKFGTSRLVDAVQAELNRLKGVAT